VWFVRYRDAGSHDHPGAHRYDGRNADGRGHDA
jgi:hypothetical protein